MPQRQAPTEERHAPLSEAFGLDYATRLFGEEAVASLPTYARGRNKGKPKGYVIWLRTTAPGYHVNAGGGVGAGVTVRAWIGLHPFASQGQATTGRWLGRTQTLCGSACMLGPEARAREMALMAEEHA